MGEQKQAFSCTDIKLGEGEWVLWNMSKVTYPKRKVGDFCGCANWGKWASCIRYLFKIKIQNSIRLEWGIHSCPDYSWFDLCGRIEPAQWRILFYNKNLLSNIKKINSLLFIKLIFCIRNMTISRIEKKNKFLYRKSTFNIKTSKGFIYIYTRDSMSCLKKSVFWLLMQRRFRKNMI